MCMLRLTADIGSISGLVRRWINGFKRSNEWEREGGGERAV